VAGRKKPDPISRSLSKKPKKAPVPEQAPQAFNDISPITAKQIARAEKKIGSMRDEIDELKKSPKPIRVQTTAPKVEVNLPPRPRIVSVKVKYDSFGIPEEFIPRYEEVAV
jgi:hypothetical protein